MPQGSKKPILAGDPLRRQSRPAYDPPLLQLRNGTERTALQCLAECGDLSIAAERAMMEELEFCRLLVQEDPEQLAECIKSMQLLGIFQASMKVQEKVMNRLDELKASELARLYTSMVKMVPELTASHVNFHQQNNYFEAPEEAPSGPDAELVRRALKALGIEEPPSLAPLPIIIEGERFEP